MEIPVSAELRPSPITQRDDADRIERLRELQREIQDQQHRIQTAYAGFAEAMARRAAELAAAARDADFSAPAWPEDTRRTVEVRLAETREVTFRFGSDTEPFASRPDVTISEERRVA